MYASWSYACERTFMSKTYVVGHRIAWSMAWVEDLVLDLVLELLCDF